MKSCRCRPESGTISYSYDANGNLTTRTDARGVVLTKFYDDLNRLTSNEYDNPVSPGSVADLTLIASLSTRP